MVLRAEALKCWSGGDNMDQFFSGEVSKEEAVAEINNSIVNPYVQHCKDVHGKFTVIQFYTEFIDGSATNEDKG